MNRYDTKHLQAGDRVVFDSPSFDGSGTIITVLEDDYVRVKWDNSGAATTHRRHALQRAAWSQHPPALYLA